MMSRHFGLNSELSGAIAKRLPNAKISFLRLAVSSINLLLYIYVYTKYILVCIRLLQEIPV